MSDRLQPTVEVSESDTGEAVVTVVRPELGGEVKATPLTGFLQVHDPTPAEQDKLKAVWDYITEETDSELESERLWAVRAIEQKLATPRLGQTRLDQLYQYITIDRQAKSVEKLRDGMLR